MSHEILVCRTKFLILGTDFSYPTSVNLSTWRSSMSEFHPRRVRNHTCWCRGAVTNIETAAQ